MMLQFPILPLSRQIAILWPNESSVALESIDAPTRPCILWSSPIFVRSTSAIAASPNASLVVRPSVSSPSFSRPRLC